MAITEQSLRETKVCIKCGRIFKLKDNQEQVICPDCNK